MVRRDEERGFGVPERELQALRVVWRDLQVDNLLLRLRDRLASERRGTGDAKHTSIYGLVSSNVSFGNPSLVTAINISKPRIIASLQYDDVIFGFLHGSDRPEEVPESTRAFALGLNRAGLYTRYRENRPVFLERADRIHGHGDLQLLIDENIRQESGRHSIADMFFGNKPR